VSTGEDKLKGIFSGKVVGFSVNNVRIGPVEATTPAKVRTGDPEPLVTVNMYFASWDRVGNDPKNPSPTPATVPPYPKISVSKNVTPSNLWYPPYPYSVTVPGDTTLMEAFLPVQNDPLSLVTNIVTIGERTANNPDWLEEFEFNGTLYDQTDNYIWDYDENENIIGGTWYGWAPMYFIGTPLAYDSLYPNSPNYHNSYYPDLRLNQFLANELPLNSFTISYERSSYSFEVRTETINGETVHTFIKKN
jgi:hypothetical protein